MPPNRRGFLSRTLAGLGALALGRSSSAAATSGRTDQVPCLDYGRSFVSNPAPMNAVRFWIESRTILIDDAQQHTTEFFQCASCKSENTFAESHLFKEDNYDFMPIFGGEDLLIFRRPVSVSDRYRQVIKAEEVWGKPEFKTCPGQPVRELHNWEDIRTATAAGIPIVARTEIANADVGLRAVIEYPVKTMNVSLEHKLYQVDTGPIAYPDLAKRRERAIDSLSLAFVAFNAPDFADFIVEQPTPILQDDQPVAQTYHYSNPFSLTAQNALFAVGTRPE